MKTLNPAFLIAVCSFLFTHADAQLFKIPSAVTDSFKARFPIAEKVSWKGRVTAYQANFYMDNTDMEARFSSKGEWESTEKVMKLADLPADVRDGLDKSKYRDWKVEDVYIRYIPGNIVQYHLEVNGGGLQKKNLLFSKEGWLLKDNNTL